MAAGGATLKLALLPDEILALVLKDLPVQQVITVSSVRAAVGVPLALQTTWHNQRSAGKTGLSPPTCVMCLSLSPPPHPAIVIFAMCLVMPRVTSASFGLALSPPFLLQVRLPTSNTHMHTHTHTKEDSPCASLTWALLVCVSRCTRTGLQGLVP